MTRRLLRRSPSGCDLQVGFRSGFRHRHLFWRGLPQCSSHGAPEYADKGAADQNGENEHRHWSSPPPALCCARRQTDNAADGRCHAVKRFTGTVSPGRFGMLTPPSRGAHRPGVPCCAVAAGRAGHPRPVCLRIPATGVDAPARWAHSAGAGFNPTGRPPPLAGCPCAAGCFLRFAGRSSTWPGDGSPPQNVFPRGDPRSRAYGARIGNDLSPGCGW
jgi:hypothetical protein